jgi:low affinity Fe/Cu permease
MTTVPECHGAGLAPQSHRGVSLAKISLHKKKHDIDNMISDPDRESMFERAADYVSAAMGRPTNIMIWLVLVVSWTLLFATGLVNPAGTFLPGWFTSQGFNFPLNLITTVAELFIGFLVAAASNRSERNLNRTLALIVSVEKGLQDSLNSNTELTKQVHNLTQQVHDLVAAQKG